MKQVSILTAIILLTAACEKADLVTQSTADNSVNNVAAKSVNYEAIVSNTTPSVIGGIMPIVTDCDGNIYHTVTIGTQTWMVENLKTTKYRDCTPIENVTDQERWRNLRTGAYVNYNNDPANGNVYGRLYNWYAASNVRKIAPVGWHVPSAAEWATLVNYLGGDLVAGGKLKEPGFSHWQSPNPTQSGANVGFMALPGGYHPSSYFQKAAFFWTSNESASSSSAVTRALFYTNKNAFEGGHAKDKGLSIRCIKDNYGSANPITR